MSFPEPQFQRVDGTRLLWLGSDKTIGFFASSSFSGDTPLLSATWSGDPLGVYLFVGSSPASDAAFAAALPDYLAAAGWPDGPKFLWLMDPNAAIWIGQTLDLVQSGGTWTVRRRADFRFANYALSVLGGSIVTLAIAAQDWGFALTAQGLPPATFFAPGGQYDANATPLLLPFAGPQAACWRCAITLPNGGGAPDDFARLGVGLRYFYPDRSIPDRPEMGVLHLSTIAQPVTPALNMDVAMDPLRPTAPDRSWLSFFPLNATPPAFESTFATARGYGVTMTALPAAAMIADARLVFSVQPRYLGPAPVPIDYYLSPLGAFSLSFPVNAKAETTGAINRLLCGASGLEYLGLPTDQPSQIVFVPGQPAFAPLADTSSIEAPLTSLGTTSWIWASSGSKVGYYAQPEDAPLYRAIGASARATDDDGFLDYLEIPALQLAPVDGVRSFPVAPFRQLPAGEVAAALTVEAAALAPARRQALLNADPAAWTPRPSGAAVEIGVTPQGIAVGVGNDGMEWDWLGFANDTDEPQAVPSLSFTRAAGAFRQAIETNQLFMVAANADTFFGPPAARNASVEYQLTAEGIAELRVEAVVPAAILDAVQAYFSTAGYPVFDDEDSFVQELVKASAGAAAFALAFERKSGLLIARIGEWKFQLSPRNWHNPQRPSRQNVLTVFKFNVGRSLADMTDEVATWTWPEVAIVPDGTIGDAQAELQSIYRAARESYAQTSTDGRTSPYANFIRVLDDRSWTGIIVFSCDMPLSALPAQLQSLAAGIDATRFYAHHVGFNITPFSVADGALSFAKTSMFGLLDYQDPVDQFFQDNRAYMFKVLKLSVGFRNSVMVDFSSRVELLINRLFGAAARLYPTNHGNNVILNGVYQRQNDQNGLEHGTYVFSMEQQNIVGIENAALRWVVLSSTQLVTTRPADPAHPETTVVALFQTAGNLLFYEAVGCDLFSFGQSLAEEANGVPVQPGGSALRFGNLVIRMEFTMAARVPSFTFVTETLSFDLSNSTSRAKALFALFPLKLSGFVATADPPVIPPSGSDAPESAHAPASMGYASIGAPIQQARLGDPWYGLVYEIDLGTLGALAGSVGLTLSLLVAWSGGGTREAPAVYVGVKLPGMKESLGVELPLQGILTLGFKSIQLLVDDDPKTGARQYMLRFRNFAIRFLGLAFPPGYNDILLAGNPDSSSPSKLGWYAAYSAEKDAKKKQLPSATTRLVVARKLPAALLASRVEP
jgi:hypothetical protein